MFAQFHSFFFVDTILLMASDIKIDCLLKLAPHMLYACNWYGCYH